MWPYPKLIAHRGAGVLAPENTLAAARAGASCGYRMLEYDVKVTADGIPILLHDDTLERTSDGKGRASHYSFKELATCDFGSWHSRAFAGEPVATLQSIARFTIANGIYSNIEIKPEPGLEETTGDQVARAASKLWAGASARPLLSSFSETALETARHAAPHLPRALLLAGPMPIDWGKRLQRLNCLAVNLHFEHITPALIQEVQAEGYRIVAWTINEIDLVRRYLSWGCDAIVTDAVSDIAPDL